MLQSIALHLHLSKVYPYFGWMRMNSANVFHKDAANSGYVSTTWFTVRLTLASSPSMLGETPNLITIVGTLLNERYKSLLVTLLYYQAELQKRNCQVA